MSLAFRYHFHKMIQTWGEGGGGLRYLGSVSSVFLGIQAEGPKNLQIPRNYGVIMPDDSTVASAVR